MQQMDLPPIPDLQAGGAQTHFRGLDLLAETGAFLGQGGAGPLPRGLKGGLEEVRSLPPRLFQHLPAMTIAQRLEFAQV
jgi:hypothetical protein